MYYEIVLHQKSLFSKHAAQRPLNSMHQNYASSIETMNATEKETPNPDGYWSFLTNFEVDGHVNLIIEIIGFLVLIAAAVCEYVYKYESAALPGVDTLSPNTRIRFESYVVLSQYYGFWKGLYLYWMQYVPDAIRFRYVVICMCIWITMFRLCRGASHSISGLSWMSTAFISACSCLI